MVISDARGRYVYGSLAGVPTLNSNNQAEINGTDLKSMLNCDIYLKKTHNAVFSVGGLIKTIFDEWNSQIFGVDVLNEPEQADIV